MSKPRTKAELEVEIERLNQVIRDQEKLLRGVRSEAVEVTIPAPGSEYSSRLSHAPYISTFSSKKNEPWVAKVLTYVYAAIRQIGVRTDVRTGIGGGGGYMIFTESAPYGEQWVVPKLIAECLAELINRAGDFGHDCYIHGHREGTDLLRQLGSGRLTPDEFNDRKALEEATENHNNYKRYKVRKWDEH